MFLSSFLSLRRGVRAAAGEQLIAESDAVLVLLDLVKVVHVKLGSRLLYLPDKGGEVAVAEVPRQYFLREELKVENGEADAVGGPADDIGELWILQ